MKTIQRNDNTIKVLFFTSKRQNRLGISQGQFKSKNLSSLSLALRPSSSLGTGSVSIRI